MYCSSCVDILVRLGFFVDFLINLPKFLVIKSENYWKLPGEQYHIQ